MTPTTTTPPARPFLLPALINPFVQPVASRSTPGLLHMVIRGDTQATPGEVVCPICMSKPEQECIDSRHGERMGFGHPARHSVASRTLVTRWYCTGTQRPHNGPHCRPGCVHIRSVKEQLEREEN